ncbi:MULTISPECIES: IS1182 family transposase [Sphingopyxis]|jgi:Transposase and inactivated derivatives|uniref:Transposase n=1 Tax=Sphingopyxis flava TaxID=1507287 RepID=A0A1T5GCA0_9SPHN|nr:MULTISPECIES: IS1182 family transposase [Sphingopyxis]ALC10925.1 transposase [Sphingopyxis sp. 113P3]SKC06054.1 Transposase [Sphingopyxis flava]
MLGRKERDQLELFITGSLRQLIPDEHILVRVDAVLDLSWLRDEITDLYCIDNGRPGIDPEVAVRLMLAGFLLGIVHDRRLMREAAVNIAIRWFVGYGLHEPLPDHSSLTRIRQRWGAERFRRIFERTVQACVAAKIATGEVVHLDASLIRAHVSWDSLAVRHVEAVAEANDEALRDSRQSGKFKKVCVTDPDATMATNGRNRRLEPAYKQHTAVDDVAGVIVDVEIATGEENEGMAVAGRLDAVAATTGQAITTATMDAGYAYAKVFRALEDREIEGIVPAKAEPPPGKVIPTRRFKFDARHNVARCPKGKILRPKGKLHRGAFQYFHARAKDCGRCPLQARCVSPSRRARVVVFNVNHPSLLRARRKRSRWSNREERLYQRHRWRVEGVHGEAKTWHGLARAVRRGLDNMRIQAFLTAAAINLKRLAAALISLICAVLTAGVAENRPPRYLTVQ